MNIKRFFGKNSREALSMVRRELGEDAVILSNRAVNGGNEIMAFKEEDMSTMLATSPSAPPAVERRAAPLADSSEPTSLLSHLNRTARAQAAQVAEQPVAAPVQRRAPEPLNVPSARPVESVAPSQLSATQASQQMAEMLNEIRIMRSEIESQLTSMSWGNIQQREPLRAKVLSTLLSAGFSASLSRRLAEKMPDYKSQEKAMQWVESILVKNLNSVEYENEVLDQGGVFALIGPTGVGKTTTTAKLAARFVMKHGTQQLGLITTDAYRVGGHEQLRIYGKILGVMVHAVKDEADLKIALNELKNKHTILIDTVGVSQRDRMVAEQIAMLSETRTPIKKLLCLNATNTGETLTDVVKAYHGKGLDGCIITKVDEAATIGSSLDVIIREKLKLYYVANGQRVPEDIHLSNKQQLIRHALKLSASSNASFQFQHDELPFVMGNTVNAAGSKQLTEIGYV